MKTASGQQHRIIGKVNLSIMYKDQQHKLLLYLFPDLEQVLYLGIDFWRCFGLAPDVIGIEELEIEKLQKDMKDDRLEHKMKQRNKLNEIIKCFDSFEEKCLGCTSLEKHSIKLIDVLTIELDYTAFIVAGRPLYQFRVMPFGVLWTRLYRTD